MPAASFIAARVFDSHERQRHAARRNKDPHCAPIPPNSTESLFSIACAPCGERSETHPHPHSHQAIPHLRARRDFHPAARQTKPHLQHRSFREPCRRIDEHSAHADVGRPHPDVFIASFVTKRELPQVRKTHSRPRPFHSSCLPPRFHRRALPRPISPPPSFPLSALRFPPAARRRRKDKTEMPVPAYARTIHTRWPCPPLPEARCPVHLVHGRDSSPRFFKRVFLHQFEPSRTGRMPDGFYLAALAYRRPHRFIHHQQFVYSHPSSEPRPAAKLAAPRRPLRLHGFDDAHLREPRSERSTGPGFGAANTQLAYQPLGHDLRQRPAIRYPGISRSSSRTIADMLSLVCSVRAPGVRFAPLSSRFPPSRGRGFPA